MELLSQISPALSQLGVDLNKISPDKIHKLMSFAENIKDPNDITPEMARNVMNILGVHIPQVEPGQIAKSSRPRARRNDPCLCKSGRKYKLCCLNKDVVQ